MATSSKKNIIYAQSLREIGVRRSYVAKSIRSLDPTMKSEERWTRLVKILEQDVFRKLFDEVHDTPVTDNYVAWMVNCQLWRRFHKAVKPQFLPEFFTDPPDKLFVGPFCANFLQYQSRRVAREKERQEGLESAEYSNLQSRQQPPQPSEFRSAPKETDVSGTSTPQPKTVLPRLKPVQTPQQLSRPETPKVPPRLEGRPRTKASETNNIAPPKPFGLLEAEMQSSLKGTAGLKKRKRELLNESSPTLHLSTKKARANTELRTGSRKASSPQVQKAGVTKAPNKKPPRSLSTEMPVRLREYGMPEVPKRKQDRPSSTQIVRRTTGPGITEIPGSNQERPAGTQAPRRPAEIETPKTSKATKTAKKKPDQSSSAQAIRRPTGANVTGTPTTDQSRTSSSHNQTENPRRNQEPPLSAQESTRPARSDNTSISPTAVPSVQEPRSFERPQNPSAAVPTGPITPRESVQGSNDVFAISRRLQTLSFNDIPGNTRDWPRFTWRAMYGDMPPPQHGDYFALPIHNGWVPLVSAAVLMRAHKVIDPIVRVEVRENTGEGYKLLAVSLSGHGNPNSIFHMYQLADTWADLLKWHRHMVEDDMRYPLDDFLQENLAHKLAIKIDGTRC